MMCGRAGTKRGDAEVVRTSFTLSDFVHESQETDHPLILSFTNLKTENQGREFITIVVSLLLSLSNLHNVNR